MKKLFFIPLIIMMLLALSGCSSTEKQLEKAAKYVDDGNYDKAIALYEKLIEKDELTYWAWLGLADAYIADKEYEDADDTLQDLFELIDEHYDIDDKNVDYDDIFDEMNDLAKAISKKGEALGKWHTTLNPPSLNLYDDILYNYGVGDIITLSIPKGLEFYYTLDGSKATKRSTKYKDGIEVTEAGEFELVGVLMNKFGIVGDQSYGYFYAAVRPDPPRVTVSEGEYDGPLVVYFEDYDSDKGQIYYTIDGSDPISNGYYYYEEDGVILESGDYVLQAVMLDYNTYEYSGITTAKYAVFNPYVVTEETMVTVGVFDIRDDVYDYVTYAISDLMWEQELLKIETLKLKDITEATQALLNGTVDMVFSPTMYIEDFVNSSALLPITDFYDLTNLEFNNNAPEAGRFNGNYYSLPVTIAPDLMLYFNSYYLDGTAKTWDAFIASALATTTTYNFLYPEEFGYWFNAFYLGFGGKYTRTNNGPITLDYQPLVDAFKFINTLPESYGIGYPGMSWEDYTTSLYDRNTAYILTNATDVETYNGYYTYYPMGSMPLPNGNKTKSFNLVNGLSVSSLIKGDTNKIAAARSVYKYLSSEYYISSIASYGESLPAIMNVVDKDYLYLDTDVEIYEEVINNNITMNLDYAVFDTLDAMTFYISEMFYNGMTPEAAASALIDEVASY